MSAIPPSGPGGPRPSPAYPPGGRRAAGWAALVLLLLAWLVPTAPGCAARRTGRGDPVRAALGRCAGADATPLDAAALDTRVQCLLDASVAWPDEGRVQAAVAEALYVRGLAFPVEGRDDLVSARTWALRCLSLRPAFAGRLATAGGRLEGGALAVVPAEDVACLTWASLAWSRWIEQRGVLGVAIDLAPVRALAGRAAALDPTWDGGRPRAALGLALALVPALLERDAGGAEENLDLAVEAGDLLARVDRAALVAAPAGREAAWREDLEAVLAAPGAPGGLVGLLDEVARTQARALLEQGMPTPTSW